MLTDTHWLLADIGGSNARFATSDKNCSAWGHELVLATSDFPSLTEAAKHYLAQTSQPAPAAICVAVAGPVAESSARLTNNTWQISQKQLSLDFEINEICVLNDFEAIAYALPEIGRQYSKSLGGKKFEPGLARQCFAVIGPGTGLGAAGLIKHNDKTIPLVTEAGHKGFAPENDLQTTIRERLLEKFTRISDERLVSGQGIENIYWALRENRHDDSIEQINAATIFARHLAGTDATATQSVTEFFRILGQVAGDLVLSLGAFDGIFICGGLAQRHSGLLQTSLFREGFEAKGRHRKLLENTPTLIVGHPQPGLLGTLVAAKARRQ